MKIYTKRGDSGETSLLGGTRVWKDELQVEAYGTIDELNAALGIVQALSPPPDISEMLNGIQKDLFDVGTELACSDKKSSKIVATIDDTRTSTLEKAIDQMEDQLTPLANFILPGGSIIAAHLHFARTVCRRAERSIVHLSREKKIRPELLRYINRLSDFLFVLARFTNHRLKTPETLWKRTSS